MSEVLTNEEFNAAHNHLILAARKSFVAFLYLLWPQQEGQPYIIAALHLYLARMVDRVMRGRLGPHQSVSVPPQHGKSQLLSVRAVAWLLGAYPDINVAMTGAYETLLQDFLRDVKHIMSTPEYQEVFPNVRPVTGYNRASAVRFTNGSEVQCRSTGSKLIGRRVDYLIVDDPHKGRDEAESPADRRKIKQWFQGDCVTRLSVDAKIFIVSTRWHPEDLHASVTEPESEQIFKDAGFENAIFHVTNIPAMCDDPDTDPLGRDEGEACFPEQRPIEFLRLRKTSYEAYGELYEWESQFQGQPKPKGGDLADTKKIVRIDLDDVPEELERVRGIDPAIADSGKSDFTAGALCAAKINDEGIIEEFYLIDIWRTRGPYAARKKYIENTLDYDNIHNGVNRAGIEGVSGFEAIMQETKSEFLGRIKIMKMNFKGDKILRAQPWFNLIEAGRFYMVRGDWNQDFIQELEFFPSGKHDDQVDAVSIAREVAIKKPAKIHF